MPQTTAKLSVSWGLVVIPVTVHAATALHPVPLYQVHPGAEAAWSVSASVRASRSPVPRWGPGVQFLWGGWCGASYAV